MAKKATREQTRFLGFDTPGERPVQPPAIHYFFYRAPGSEWRLVFAREGWDDREAAFLQDQLVSHYSRVLGPDCEVRFESTKGMRRSRRVGLLKEWRGVEYLISDTHERKPEFDPDDEDCRFVALQGAAWQCAAAMEAVPPDPEDEDDPEIATSGSGIANRNDGELSKGAAADPPSKNLQVRKAKRYKPPPCPECGGRARVVSTRKNVRFLKCQACEHKWKLACPQTDTGA